MEQAPPFVVVSDDKGTPGTYRISLSVTYYGTSRTGFKIRLARLHSDSRRDGNILAPMDGQSVSILALGCNALRPARLTSQDYTLATCLASDTGGKTERVPRSGFIRGLTPTLLESPGHNEISHTISHVGEPIRA